MSIIPQINQAMRTLLTTTTETVAATLHYVKRADRATFTPSTLVQTFVYGWLAHPTATVEQLAGHPLGDRLTVSAWRSRPKPLISASPPPPQPCSSPSWRPVTQRVPDHAIAADPVAIPILQRFSSVRVYDSTTSGLPDALTTTWRGCGNDTARGTAGLTCGVQIDLLTGALCGLDVVHGRDSDYTLPVQHAPMPVGSLRLADLGFYSMDVLTAMGRAGVYWVSRLQSTSLLRVNGQAVRPLLAVVESLGSVDHWDGAVIVGTKGQLPARLLVRRVPKKIAKLRRQRVRTEAKGKCRPAAKAALALADWNIAITNVPPEMLTRTEVMVLLRIRWQIELLFKLWKSHGRVDAWRTENPTRMLCEIYAKVLGLVFQQWILVASSWVDSERSLFKAAQIVAFFTAEFASAQQCAVQCEQVLSRIARMIRRLARTNKRQKTATTAQRLLALTAVTS